MSIESLKWRIFLIVASVARGKLPLGSTWSKRRVNLCLRQHGSLPQTSLTVFVSLSGTGSAEGCSDPKGGIMLGLCTGLCEPDHHTEYVLRYPPVWFLGTEHCIVYCGYSSAYPTV